jgi:hypothetical protein
MHRPWTGRDAPGQRRLPKETCTLQCVSGTKTLIRPGSDTRVDAESLQAVVHLLSFFGTSSGSGVT